MEQLISYFGKSNAPVNSFFAPGRVNLIGEHIDYNGGLVLPIAIPLGIKAWMRENNQGQIRIQSKQQRQAFYFDLKHPKQMNYQDWRDFPQGVIQYLLQQDIALTGVDLLIESNLPMGTGLSSSAALELLLLYALLSSIQHPLAADKLQLAKMAQQIEHEFIGVKCGIMDQFAVAMGQEHKAMLLNCATLHCDYIPFEPTNYNLLILNTNKPRALVTSKYNERLAECRAALRFLQQKCDIQHLVAATLDDLTILQTKPILYQRAKHVITEGIRVQKAVEALKQGNWKVFGQCMNASHQSLKEDYEVTGVELDTLVHIAQQTDGCIGARMTGAGFGGCAIALVHQTKVATFKSTVKQKYDEQTQLSLSTYTATATTGVHRL